MRRRSLTTSGPALVEETIELIATPEELAAIHAALGRFWDAVDRTVDQPPRHEWRLRFATAVAEVAANIVRYAYPEGITRGTMRLRLRCYVDRVVASFSDHGTAATIPSARPRMPLSGTKGQAVSAIQNSPGSDPMALPEGGYGWRLSEHL